MTSFHVKDGTHAGWRKLLPARINEWKCPSCGHVNKPNYSNCWLCGERRP